MKCQCQNACCRMTEVSVSKCSLQDGDCEVSVSKCLLQDDDCEVSVSKCSLQDDDCEVSVSKCSLQDDDCEEGEIKEPGSSKKPFVKPTCRFFLRGACTWGLNCRFLHPGINDKGWLLGEECKARVVQGCLGI